MASLHTLDRSLSIRSISWRWEKRLLRVHVIQHLRSLGLIVYKSLNYYQATGYFSINLPNQINFSFDFPLVLKCYLFVLPLGESPLLSDLDYLVTDLRRCRSTSHDAIHVHSTQKDTDEKEELISEREKATRHFSFVFFQDSSRSTRIISMYSSYFRCHLKLLRSSWSRKTSDDCWTQLKNSWEIKQSKTGNWIK